jgi:hypothetical protein
VRDLVDESLYLVACDADLLCRKSSGSWKAMGMVRRLAARASYTLAQRLRIEAAWH